jgi:hypothetical protein
MSARACILCVAASLLCFTRTGSAEPAELDHALLHEVYTTIFRLRDGSTLSSIDSTAVEAMRGSLRRIVGVGGGGSGSSGSSSSSSISNSNASDGGGDLLRLARGLPDDRLLGLLLLAVAGNFTVDQSPSALPQKCGIVVDPGTGALMLRDNAVAQSVILEVLLIVSIVCLLGAWGNTSSSSNTSSNNNKEAAK